MQEYCPSCRDTRSLQEMGPVISQGGLLVQEVVCSFCHSTFLLPMTHYNPGYQLAMLLEQIFPPDPTESSSFVMRVDKAFVANGELSNIAYKSMVSYLVRRLIMSGKYLRRLYGEDDMTFIRQLRMYLTRTLNLNDAQASKLVPAIRECIAAKRGKHDISELRQAIRLRDGSNCYICGRPLAFNYQNAIANQESEATDETPLAGLNSQPPQVLLRPEVEHEWPIAVGGRDAMFNFRLACNECNEEKGDYINSSDYHYEQISIQSRRNDDHFWNEFEHVSRMAVWAKQGYKCADPSCDRQASRDGSLEFVRRDPDDSWHYLNIDAYCDYHASRLTRRREQ